MTTIRKELTFAEKFVQFQRAGAKFNVAGTAAAPKVDAEPDRGRPVRCDGKPGLGKFDVVKTERQYISSDIAEIALAMVGKRLKRDRSRSISCSRRVTARAKENVKGYPSGEETDATTFPVKNQDVTTGHGFFMSRNNKVVVAVPSPIVFDSVVPLGDDTLLERTSTNLKKSKGLYVSVSVKPKIPVIASQYAGPLSSFELGGRKFQFVDRNSRFVVGEPEMYMPIVNLVNGVLCYIGYASGSKILKQEDGSESVVTVITRPGRDANVVMGKNLFLRLVMQL